MAIGRSVPAGHVVSVVARPVAAGFGAVARVRRAKAIHPRGSVSTGRLHRTGLVPPIGVPWLDGPGKQPVLVRTSRGVGLPGPFPDVLGLAVRVLPVDGGAGGDLLLSSVVAGGRGVRHLLRPGWDPAGATYTTIVPYGSAAGPVLLAAVPRSGGLVLAVAVRGGPLREFGVVEPDQPGGWTEALGRTGPHRSP